MGSAGILAAEACGDARGACRFDKSAFSNIVAARIAMAADTAPGRHFGDLRNGGGLQAEQNGSEERARHELLLLDVLARRRQHAEPKKPFASITPGCQRMHNYYFSTCVYAPPMLRKNDPQKVPLGERR